MSMSFKQFVKEAYKPKLFTKQEAKEVFDYLTNGDEMSSSAEEKLYELCSDDMPYGVLKARDGTPEEWYADHFGSMTDEEIQDWLDRNTEK